MTICSTMANSKTLLSTFLITFIFSSLVTASNNYYNSISKSQLGYREEKLTHLHFFYHDIVTGPKPTMVITGKSPFVGKSESPLPFGSIVVFEDPLTEGPEFESKQLGVAQGFYLTVSHEAVLELELVMGMTFAFKEGDFNGSTLTVLGRNTIGSPVREMPILGGTGAFQFARGFLQARTHIVDYYTGDATVEYNVYVFHYPAISSSNMAFDEGFGFIKF